MTCYPIIDITINKCHGLGVERVIQRHVNSSSHLLGGSYGFGCGGPFCFSGENDSLKLDKDKSLH